MDNDCAPVVLPINPHRPSFLNDQEWRLLTETFHLSPRETEISTLILCGKSEREIAEVLSISAHTVHSHLERMHRKLNVHTRDQLVMVLFRTYVQAYRAATALQLRATTLSTKASSKLGDLYP